MNVWLTVPTRGNRPSLARLVNDCGLPRESVVLVHTAESSTDIDGCVNLRDLAEVNIQRWWNLGIETAATLGADVVVVANDDISVSGPGDVTMLAAAAAPFSYVKPIRRKPRQMSGWCWAIRPHDTDLRPDEAYRWYYGEDDLELRANAADVPLVAVDVGITHLTLGKVDERLKPIVAADTRRFHAQHLVR